MCDEVKWNEAVDKLCACMNLDKKEMLVAIDKEIDRLKNLRYFEGLNVIVGDRISQSLYHLFHEVKEQMKRYDELLRLKQDIFLPDIWKIIIDYDSISKTRLSIVMPLLDKICINWWDYTSKGLDNSAISISCREIYTELGGKTIAPGLFEHLCI